MLAALAIVACQDTGVPYPERDLELELGLNAPSRCHAWWAIVVEAWVESHSSHAVPIVRAMDGSWNDRVEPYLHFAGTYTGPDGRSTALPNPVSFCGNYDSNWVAGILSVRPGGRERILSIDIHDLLGTGPGPGGRERAGSVDLGLEYVYEARPSRPSQWGAEPADQAARFGALAGVAPFRLTSDCLHLELVPPPVDARDIERDLVLELEL